MRRSQGTAAVLLAAAIVVAAFAAGCGGGDDEQTTGAGQRQTTGTQGTTSAEQPSKKAEKNEKQSGGQSSAGPTKEVSGFNVVEKPTAKQLAIAPGYDNSLQTFGETAQGEDLSAVLDAMKGYFQALRSGNYEAACPYMADSFAEQMSGVSDQARAQQKKDPLEGCAAVADGISKITNPGPTKSEARLALTANVLRVGRSGSDDEIPDTAIVLFRHRGGSSLYSFTMRLEDGEWKAIALVPTPWPNT